MNNTSTFDSVYQVKLAQIAALEGDTTKNYDSVFQTELEILKKLEEGGMGAQIDDTEVSTGKVWSSYKTQDYAAAVGFHYMYVQTLPATGQPRTIYFVPTGETPVQGQPNDVCNEYMYFGTPDSSFAYWEQIGTRRVDMSQYYTKAQIDASLDVLVVKEGDTWTAEQAAKFHALMALPAEQFLKKFAVAKNIGGNTFILLYPKAAIYNSDGTGGTLCFTANYNQESWRGNLATPPITGEYPVNFTIWGTDGYAHITDVDASLATKQATLVSGTNIKTINNNSILGSGNITIQGGGGAGVVELTQAEYDALAVKDPSIIYNITDASVYVMEDYFSKAAADASFGELNTKYNPYNTTSAQTSGYYLPKWNARGQITGTGNYMYQRSFSINGSAQTLYGTGSGSLTGIYAATTAGTSGQVLQSTGSGAPQWVDFRSDATYYISESDCSTGTYSNDISAFYADCIASEHIGPMQLVNNVSHNIGTPGDASVATVLNTDAYFVIKDGSTAQFKYGDSFISIDANGNISDPDVTEVISPETSIIVFGYHVFKNAETVDVTAGDVYLITTSVVASQSYYYPSSTRMFSGNVELWFFTTEDGTTWNNLHVLITNNSVSADATSGTFGN